MDPITFGVGVIVAVWGCCAKKFYDYMTDDDYREYCDKKHEKKMRASYQEYLKYNHENPMSFYDYCLDCDDYVEDGGDRVS